LEYERGRTAAAVVDGRCLIYTAVKDCLAYLTRLRPEKMAELEGQAGGLV
jgi:hypothetical protein